jgi:hypothetical protein
VVRAPVRIAPHAPPVPAIDVAAVLGVDPGYMWKQ